MAINGLKELAANLGLKDNVWFTGFISESDMIRYLSTADICVDPDPSNPFNDRCTMIKMMEYMALNKPIVAFDLPEHRVTAGGAALYAQPNDELDFARQIASFMTDPERRQKWEGLVENELKRVSLAQQMKALIEAYEMLNH
jgi:glycosyltransferase involved in cell wall biosynthesis